MPANVLIFRDHDEIVGYITTSINPKRKMPVFRAMPRSEADAVAGYLIKLRAEYDAISDDKKSQPLSIEP